LNLFSLKHSYCLESRNMNLPIRALYEIRAFSKPCTRPDWRICKNQEATAIGSYNDWYYFLVMALDWEKVTDENGYRVFFDAFDVKAHLRETNMVNRLVEFEKKMPLELTMMQITSMWCLQHWFRGLMALRL
jgi:hypothetical protein